MSDTGFSGLVGFTVASRGDGRAELLLDVEPRHLNPHGTVHGGAIATLVDSAMGLAVATTTEEGEGPVTIEMKVTYLEPGTSQQLKAQAHVRRRGKRITIVEADVVDADDEAVAHAIATFTTVG